MGKGIVDKLKEEFPIDDRWYSYELRPETPAEGALLAQRFPPEQLEKMYENLRRMGAPYGIVFGKVTVTPNSRLALAASEYARDKGSFHSFHERVFRAHFTQCRNVGSFDVLLELAEEEGLDRDDLLLALEEDRYAERLAEARREAGSYGVTAIPTFILGDKDKVVGAQSLDFFRKRLRELRGSG